MLANLVDKQEQDQQIPRMSLGSVSSPIGIKNVQKDELLLAQQEKYHWWAIKTKLGLLMWDLKKSSA